MRVFVLLFLFGCASEPLTQEETEYRAQIELERAEQYVGWAKGCLSVNGVVFTDRPWGRCRKQRINGRIHCIPHHRDWQPNRTSNNTICVSRESLRGFFK